MGEAKLHFTHAFVTPAITVLYLTFFSNTAISGTFRFMQITVGGGNGEIDRRQPSCRYGHPYQTGLERGAEERERQLGAGRGTFTLTY